MRGSMFCEGKTEMWEGLWEQVNGRNKSDSKTKKPMKLQTKS